MGIIRYEKEVDTIMSIIEEAKARSYDDTILKMDLDKFIDELMTTNSYKINEAYEDGKEFAYDDAFEDGREDGYDEGYEEGKQYVYSKLSKLSSELSEILENIE